MSGTGAASLGSNMCTETCLRGMSDALWMTHARLYRVNAHLANSRVCSCPLHESDDNVDDLDDDDEEEDDEDDNDDDNVDYFDDDDDDDDDDDNDNDDDDDDDDG